MDRITQSLQAYLKSAKIKYQTLFNSDTQGGKTKTEVRLANESVWLPADQMAELFQRDKNQYLSVNISIHN